MDAVNAGLATAGAAYRVAVAECISDGESGEIGKTVIAENVENKQLSGDRRGHRSRDWQLGRASRWFYRRPGDSRLRRELRRKPPIRNLEDVPWPPSHRSDVCRRGQSGCRDPVGGPRGRIDSNLFGESG